MKKIIVLISVMFLICGCTKNSHNTKEQEEEQLYSNSSVVVNEDIKITQDNEAHAEGDSKGYFGEWEIRKLFFSEAPSIWGKEELEKLIGKKLMLSSKKAIFDGTELSNPQYGERVILQNEIVTELVTTYEELNLDSKNPPLFVTIYTSADMTEDSEWILDSMIYRFFVKDSNTIIAENRNVYFELSRIK